MAGLAAHPQLVQQSTTPGMQYTMSSPLMTQPSSGGQQGGQLAGSSPAGLAALDTSSQGTSLASHPGMAMPSPYPGYSLANIPGVDWSSLGYSLPAMYTL